MTIPQWPHLGLSPAEMFTIGVGRAGMLRIPASPQLALDFLPVVARTIQHYGVEVNGLRYNGAALNGYRNATSPYGGALAGKWPIRINPDDVRHAWFQDPDDQSWHRLDWEHAAGLDTPFSADAAAYARWLAAAPGTVLDPAKALAQLLDRWGTGMVTDRRERRMAARLSAEYAALPAVEPPDPEPDRRAPKGSEAVDDCLAGDDDESDFTGPDEEDGFYDDAFEVLT